MQKRKEVKLLLKLLIKRNSETKLPFPIISLIELNIENYSEKELPSDLKQLPIMKPGSREYLTK